MEAKFTQEEIRQKRHQLYQNPVFQVTHEVLRPLLRSLGIVELFIFAERFTQGLLAHPPIDSSMMEYEVDDLRDDLADCYGGTIATADFRLLLILSLVKLYALRHTHLHARQLLRVLLPFCQEYEGLRELLGQFIVKEQQLRRQGRITFQKRPKQPVPLPLADTSHQPAPLEEARAFVERFVGNCECLSPASIEHVLLPLMATNEQYAGAFSELVNRLKKQLGMKSNPTMQPLVQGDLVMEKRVEQEVSGVEKGGIGFVIKKMA